MKRKERPQHQNQLFLPGLVPKLNLAEKVRANSLLHKAAEKILSEPKSSRNDKPFWWQKD